MIRGSGGKEQQKFINKDIVIEKLLRKEHSIYG